MIVRPVRDADWPQLQAFARRHFGPTHLPDRRFHDHWFKTPFGGDLGGETTASESWGGMMLERPDGTMAGALLVIVLPFWFAGQATTGCYLSTGVVEADARDRGLGAALYLWAYRTFPVVLAMAGNAMSAPLNALMGQDLPGVAMRRFLRPNQPGFLDLCRPQDRALVTAPPAPLPAGVSARWVADVPADYDPLWRTVRQGIVCTVDRTAAYLRWRAGAPYVAYRILEIRRAGRLIGLAVCRVQHTPAGPVTRVTDMIAQPADAAAAWTAVAHATADTLLTDFMVVGTTNDHGLRAAGFTDATGADTTSGLDRVPHLLSPVEHRQWTSTFTLGGARPQADPAWRTPAAIYFTKGDGDRDWPTGHDLALLGRETSPVEPYRQTG